jgi:rod shape determining protein RodA
MMVVYLIVAAFVSKIYKLAFVALFAVLSLVFYYACGYVFEKVLQPHQRVRIEVLLGINDDIQKAGYNVNQAKIAIGSGGLLGKGFLNGTQTKLRYVPEQDTDFIFCTIGEESGFVGSAGLLVFYLCFIWRLLVLAERQPDRMGRVYGYSVLCIFLFHLFINVGMVLGLTPVIGIPLPFFSYGGSSLWGFTILLFIFLRMDAERNLKRIR